MGDFSFLLFISFFLLLLSERGTALLTSRMLDKCSTTKLHLQPFYIFSLVYILAQILIRLTNMALIYNPPVLVFQLAVITGLHHQVQLLELKWSFLLRIFLFVCLFLILYSVSHFSHFHTPHLIFSFRFFSLLILLHCFPSVCCKKSTIWSLLWQWIPWAANYWSPEQYSRYCLSNWPNRAEEGLETSLPWRPWVTKSAFLIGDTKFFGCVESKQIDCCLTSNLLASLENTDNGEWGS